MKRFPNLLTLLTLLTSTLLTAACAGGDGRSAAGSTSSMTMYGTIDTGVAVHN
ncbi:hypothetical protein OVY01_15605 [Robbsia sp. Bb-Pol-6]|uniref:Uncharacterized protein n=1 Tax=Robbsia betulipollinis TaxID=2981849 RepID=A0ABT3ZRU9_9BURK|nr:hypothetical protein [Robbsia betulipollinis]MCY0388608.1 hypothetical protein [Robbsia betulipollinis]